MLEKQKKFGMIFGLLIECVSNSKAGAVEKSAALVFRRREKNLLYYEGGESYGIPSGKERQTARYLPENAV